MGHIHAQLQEPGHSSADTRDVHEAARELIRLPNPAALPPLIAGLRIVSESSLR